MAEAKKQHIIAVNPAEDATPPKVTKHVANYFQPEELAMIKQAFDEVPVKWRMLGYLFMAYGDRRSEFAGIKRQNIDFERHTILISGAVLYIAGKGVYEKPYPKNEKSRYLPMSSDIEALLKKYLDWLDTEKEKWGDRWIDTDYIFTEQCGGVINPDTITQYFNRLCQSHQRKNPDFPHINPHAFRHTVVSLLLNEGLDIMSIADLVGDDPATIAKYYAHFINEGKRKASAAMNHILNFSDPDSAAQAG